MFGFGKASPFERSAVDSGLTYLSSTPAAVRSGLSRSRPMYRNVAFGRYGRDLVYSGDLTADGFSWHESGLFLGGTVPNLSVSGYSTARFFDDGTRAVNLESEQFNALYRVKCDDHRFATAFLHQRLMDALIEVGSGYFTITDGWLTVRRVNCKGDFTVTEAQLGYLQSLLLFVPQWMYADYGIDFGAGGDDAAALSRVMPALG